MIRLEKGRYVARQSDDPADIRAAQALRARCFGLERPLDIDRHDSASTHILVEEAQSGALVCCFRLLALRPEELPTTTCPIGAASLWPRWAKRRPRS